jgi:hypothetical protein
MSAAEDSLGNGPGFLEPHGRWIPAAGRDLPQGGKE